jgi:hypothetical protein
MSIRRLRHRRGTDGAGAPSRGDAPRGLRTPVIVVLVVAAMTAIAVPIVAANAFPHATGRHAAAAGTGERRATPVQVAKRDGLGVKPGQIKHVWLIILENKSYDASFTGLNRNTYLWRALPEQGMLLKNYYGTGHFSEDNYISLVSGQATQPDTQDDCPNYDRLSGRVARSGSVKSDKNFGQLVSAAGPNAAPGSNGCVYPKQVPTLFNQFDAARVSWKGYAQDLGNHDSTGPTQRRCSLLRGAVPLAGEVREHRGAQPGCCQRDRPVRSQALSVRLVLLVARGGRLQRQAHRQPVLWW